MDTKTFELFLNYEEAVKKLNLENINEDKRNDLLVAVSPAEYEELRGMNRAQRRRWLKQNRKNSTCKGTGVDP